MGVAGTRFGREIPDRPSARAVAVPDEVLEGAGIHCRVGRLVGYGVLTELVAHDECGLSACPCSCHPRRQQPGEDRKR